MKLANAKIQYPGGMIIVDRVSLDVRTAEILVPPRLRDIMDEMDKSETSSTFSVNAKANCPALNPSLFRPMPQRVSP